MLRRPLGLALALALAACNGAAPLKPATSKPKASASPGKSANGDPTPAVRTLSPQELVDARLIGKVKLISDHGGGVLSNNGGQLVSDQGGGLISDHGLGLISNNGGGLISNSGGGLIGKVKYRVDQNSNRRFGLAAAEPLRESLLSDATVEVLDGAGRPLADARGPITFTSDATGMPTTIPTTIRPRSPRFMGSPLRCRRRWWPWSCSSSARPRRGA